MKGSEQNVLASYRMSSYVRAVEKDRIVSFQSSTFDLDRHGTKVNPRGINTVNYDKNPIFLWGHDGYGSFVGAPQMENVIGRTVSYKATKLAWNHDVEFAREEDNPKAEMALRLVRAGMLNATSIGFIPLTWHDEKTEEQKFPVTIFDSVELLEVSLVPIPSNPNAQALAKALTGAGPEYRAFRDFFSQEIVPNDSKEVSLIADKFIDEFRKWRIPTVGDRLLAEVERTLSSK